MVEVIVKMAKPQACKECPWRLTNHGKQPDPGEWYTRSNLRRLWSGLRNGVSMTCHPTDDRMNEWPWRPVPAGVNPHECTGGLILQQREFSKFQARPRMTLRAQYQVYRLGNPAHMTLAGLRALVERHLLGGLPLVGKLRMTKPNLNDPTIGYDRLQWDFPRQPIIAQEPVPNFQSSVRKIQEVLSHEVSK